MIESIRIKNFRIHDKKVVEFDPLITTLVGKTDSGKSAALSAVRFACLNKPSGDAFIRHGQSDTTVTIRVDGHVVKRSRGGRGNLFELDGRTFNAFGSDVPDEIAAVLNMDEENFQRQIEGPFWFTLTPGEVSKRLNRIVNLELIDRVLTNASAEVRKAKAARDAAAERLETATERQKELAWAEAAKRDLDCIRELYTRSEEMAEKRRVLAQAVESLTNAVQRGRNAADAENTGVLALSLAERAKEIGERAASLRKSITLYNRTAEESCQARKNLEIEETKLAKVKSCPVCGAALPSQSQS